MEQKFYYSNYLDSYSILFYSVTLSINSIYLENENDFSDITQVKATVGSQLNSEVFDVPDSSTDYKDILTSISHYELTISDSKALKEYIKI
ncbi:hypothetical protein H8356DRAFT_1354024 [Neocallimastix lanati (nom. inval.)]|nr:hypothetical protein H8356DRAFT_1354024 [Neocallimastix sp. JGI-2020a]